MPVHIVVGGFFGDEGKGKTVAYLSLSRRPRAVARTGATNAGHTIVWRGRVWRLRAVPAGFVYTDALLYIARGALVDLEVLTREVEELGLRGRLRVDYMTGIITGEHRSREEASSHLSKLGSTKTGVGAAMSDRVLRRLRLARDYPELGDILADTQEELLGIHESGGLVLVEATQGYWLSLYHGTYPYVTSRDTTASAVLSELGLGPRSVERVTVVLKSFVTRVGEGPLPGEMPREEAVRRGLMEYGTVTGRPRRVAPFNYELARRAVRANTATDVAITKLDALYPEARCVREWDRLPREARQWIEEVESELGVPVSLIGTGEDVLCTIDRSVDLGL